MNFELLFEKYPNLESNELILGKINEEDISLCTKEQLDKVKRGRTKDLLT